MLMPLRSDQGAKGRRAVGMAVGDARPQSNSLQELAQAGIGQAFTALLADPQGRGRARAPSR